ncbi:flagellin [Thermogymnomonas acidicola]|uniref:Flagellin n=1 Tax=Thermogymnomonas acidicola TaxID=399579 RepID=A0AA37BR65_9ARCH|nr:flagellin [Thermogymnomonas acidicola]GGM73442.1 flagellin [Thermogymnomonas acidicola]
MNRAIRRGVKALQRVFSLKSDSKAETGIGTLIVFIAMVLVAAVAATVLIHTAGSLQQAAQSTGSATQKQVASGLSVQSIAGLDSNASDPEAGTVMWIAIYIVPNSGSSGINLANVTLDLVYNGYSASLRYIGPSGFNVATGGTQNVFDNSYFSTINAGQYTKNTAQYNDTLANSTDHFAILDLLDPNHSMTGKYPVLTAGGEVALLVNVTAVFGTGISQGTTVTGSVNPTVGSPGVIDFTAPLAYTTRVVQLQ